MIKLNVQSPKKNLKVFLKQKPLRSEMDVFKKNLIVLLDKIKIINDRPRDESEEHLKNDLRDFLRDTYYRSTNAINTKDKKDLVVHLGVTTNSEVGVIIEAKRPTNISEMISADNPNKKAFHELILYYLNERKEGNIQLKQLVITNINEWYIIDANFFDKHIYRNVQIKKLYETKLNDKKDNPFFYEEIAKIMSKMELQIPCVYFDIRDYDTILRSTNNKDDRELSALFKILSPEHLLKILTPNDSNLLNEEFYKELLHIIGLEEGKEDGRKIIGRKKKENRNAASLIEITIEALQSEEVLHGLPDISIYGETEEIQTFNISLELCIIWINRILFLKLLEGQLINYHQGNNDYRFLNSFMINDFHELFKLFHNVLGRNLTERTSTVTEKYKLVPYLNSSLFDIEPRGMEDLTIKINSLNNNGLLDLFEKTILKDNQKQINKLSTLDYLFKFLDAYDFASESTEGIQEENKAIINASVLGKVFEKINAYKDGSIFTPAFITMHMCRQSLRLAIISKFNERLAQKGITMFDKFEDVRNYTTNLFKTHEILKANEIINSLRICDPAVGSGHFLVSALNEIITIKAELGLLADKEGNKLSGYEIEIINDELIITDLKANILEYKIHDGKPINKEIQRLQKTLFYEKQIIIENCLFGVDINSNSVKICRLRLWIELLKNAYYKDETNFLELETLPNIDINIKCGNSLLSRFNIKADVFENIPNFKKKLNDYKFWVNEYKNAKDRSLKRQLTENIKVFTDDFKKRDPLIVKMQKNLDKKSNEFYNKFVTQKLFAETINPKILKQKQNLELEITKLSAGIEKIKSIVIYKNAFEWRFEFPEVLNNDGDFEGFDVVIGNPPYISAMELKKSIPEAIYKTLKENYETAKGTVDLFIYFFERGIKILKPKGELNFITPNRYLSASYGESLREFLYNNVRINEIIDYSHVKVFKEASTYPIVTSLTIQKESSNIYKFNIGKYDDDKNKINFKNVTSEKLNFLEGFIWGYLLNEKMHITEKVILNSVPITNCAIINATSTASEADDYHDLINENTGFKLINTGTIDKYVTTWGQGNLTDKGMKYLTPYLPKETLKISDNRKKLYNSPKIILAKIALSTEAFLDSNGEYASINTNCFHSFKNGFDPKFVLAWLNSKLFQYTFECFFEGLKMQGGYLLYSSPNISKMFIKKLPLEDQIPFILLVDELIKANQEGKSFLELLKEIDKLFYNLYGFVDVEINIIEGT